MKHRPTHVNREPIMKRADALLRDAHPEDERLDHKIIEVFDSIHGRVPASLQRMVAQQVSRRVRLCWEEPWMLAAYTVSGTGVSAWERLGLPKLWKAVGAETIEACQRQAPEHANLVRFHRDKFAPPDGQGRTPTTHGSLQAATPAS